MPRPEPELLPCSTSGCGGFITPSTHSGVCRPCWKRFYKKELRDWDERRLYPTKPWLPTAKYVNPTAANTVHIETWVDRHGDKTLVAGCRSSMLLMVRPVENPVPCLLCVKLMRENGLIA